MKIGDENLEQQVASAAEALCFALSRLQRRADSAQERMRNGKRPNGTMTNGRVLGDEAANVEAAAVRLNTLLDLTHSAWMGALLPQNSPAL